jgi:hypothetical protein
MTADPIVQVWAKDEGDFYFLTTLRQSDVDHMAAHPGDLGIPYDPDRVRAYGSMADAEALAAEHGATLHLS